MDKLTKAIEYFAPLLLVYPKWAQGLFIITTALFALSLVVFFVLLPSTQGKHVKDQPLTLSFAITKPQSGNFITTRRFSVEGKGANPTENNALKVQLININTDASIPVQGHLTVNSDTSWRFDYVEFQDSGPYDLVIDAIFGTKRYSKRLRINYEPDSPNTHTGNPPFVPPPVRSPEVNVTPPAVTRPYNMSFDVPTVGGQPPGWFNSSGVVGGVSTAYEIRVVPRPDGGNGACVLFQNPRATKDEFGSLMQRFPASYLASKTIRLEGEVKTKDVEQWAGLWLRADNDDNMVFFDNMQNRPIRGTTSWTKYTIDATLPSNTVWLNYGIVLVGRGMIWADNFRLMVWNIGKGEWTDL